MVSSLADGTVTRVIEDHKGAPVTAIHCVNEQVSSATRAADLRENTHAAHQCTSFRDVSAITILQVVQRSSPKQDASRIYINTTLIQNVCLFKLLVCSLKESS